MENFEIDRTEEEREEQVKQWIKDYWLFVVFAVGLAIATVSGLKYYKQSKINEFSNTAQKMHFVNKKIQENDLVKAEALLQELREKNEKSSFSVLTSFALAKKMFDENEFKEASVQYAWVISHADDVAFRDVARIRKARTDYNDGDTVSAIRTLEKIESNVFIAEATLLKGDILLAGNQLERAKKTYESIKFEQVGDKALVKQRIELVSIKLQAQRNGVK